MKSQEYEDYADEIKNEFELHRQAHLDGQMKKMMKDAFQATMAQPPGGPGMEGPAGAPPPEGGQPPNGEGNNQFSNLNSPVDNGEPPQ